MALAVQTALMSKQDHQDADDGLLIPAASSGSKKGESSYGNVAL